jgi:hypothetical protein
MVTAVASEIAQKGLWPPLIDLSVLSVIEGILISMKNWCFAPLTEET